MHVASALVFFIPFIRSLIQPGSLFFDVCGVMCVHAITNESLVFVVCPTEVGRIPRDKAGEPHGVQVFSWSVKAQPQPELMHTRLILEVTACVF